MCIIVYKPVGQKLDRKILAQCYNKNDDGAGFAGVNDGKIFLHKSLKKFKKIYRVYNDMVIKPGLEEKIPILWHFRIKTHGHISLENCHPFKLEGGNMVFAHNGTIVGGSYERNAAESDTLLFKKNILDKLQVLEKNWIQSDVIWYLITSYIGKFSKAVFLDNKGEAKIYNEDDGEWEDGIWYSNTSYKPTITRSYSSGFNVHNGFAYGYHPVGCTCYYCEKYDNDDDGSFPVNRNSQNIYGNYKLYCRYCEQKNLSQPEKSNGICVSCANTIIYNRLVYIN